MRDAAPSKHREPCDVFPPIATHGYRKPDRSIVIALVEASLHDLPANSIRRQALEQMIEHAHG